MIHQQTRWLRFTPFMLVVALAAGCAASSFSSGTKASQAGDWDTAVEYFRTAVQEDPKDTEATIALERAMLYASRGHLDQARVLEARGQLEDARREYRRASEFDPPNRVVAAKVLEMERRIRDEVEAAQPRTSMALLRERARQTQPALIAANEPVPGLRFVNSSLRDALNSMGMAMAINVSFEQTYQDRPITVQLDGITLEQALNQILTSQQLFYKVVNERTIMVIPDTAQKRAQYEEQVIRTFFISNADATEMAQLINTVIRVPAMAVQPQIAANKTANTITVRATTNVAAIIEKIIEANDNPRAEVIIDVQILEVNRLRTKRYGLDLGSYSISTVFSPETDPRGAGGDNGAVATFAPNPFNLNTITRGISTSDFYLAVPSAVVRFLETDADTKLIAKPQLRGAEGQRITLNIGDEVPVPATVFTPLAQGGANTNPLTSFNYRTVGVIVEMTPTVTPEGDVVLDLNVENSTRGGDVNVAGQNLPSFGTRKVTTRLRLRDGEANLLAGLLRESDRKSLRGVPGLLHLPIISRLLASNETDVEQTDIVMLLTPRIVRTRELTQQDVSPIFIGTQQNLGLGGPPPLILPAPDADPTAPGAVPPDVPGQPQPQPQPQPQAAVPAVGTGAVTVAPPGSSPTPGTTVPPLANPAAGAGVGGGAQIVVTPAQQGDFQVGGGPYTVAVSANNASRLSNVSLTVTFNPAAVRVRSVQEGTLMRSGGIAATFTQQVDTTTGRVDIAIVRSGDVTGVAGSGLLSAVLFDAIGAGPANITVTGTASAPGGGQLPLQFAPVQPIAVR